MKSLGKNGEPTGIRTLDLLIKSLSESQNLSETCGFHFPKTGPKFIARGDIFQEAA